METLRSGLKKSRLPACGKYVVMVVPGRCPCTSHVAGSSFTSWNPLLDGWHLPALPAWRRGTVHVALGILCLTKRCDPWSPRGILKRPAGRFSAAIILRGRCLKKQQKLTSGKIWPQVWFPKNHSIHLIWFYFSWPFLTNQISRFQLSGSLSNIKCLLAEIEVDSTFPFLLLNQLNCWLKKKQHPWKWSLQHFNIF